MKRSPSTTAIAVVVAVLALAAAAGALGDADLGSGVSVEGGDAPPPSGERSGGSSPVESTPGGGEGGGDCGFVCSIPTARSLLGPLFVPLSPSVLAGVVVLGCLLVLAHRRRGDTTTGRSSSASSDLTAPGSRGGATAEDSEDLYSTPPDNAVVRAFQRLTAALDTPETETQTPREVGGAAVTAGYDRGAVTTLVEAFEAVRYGDREVTSERERAAERALGELDSDENEHESRTPSEEVKEA